MTLPHSPDISLTDFVALYGGIYEHSPWVAEGVHGSGLGTDDIDPDQMAARMAQVVAGAPEAVRLELIRMHPDLAGKAAIAGNLTVASKTEQSGAGLDQCSPVEFRRFGEMNTVYREKFGFPLVIAVAGLNRHDILTAFERRVGNSHEVEFDEALGQINLIAKFRLRALADRGR